MSILKNPVQTFIRNLIRLVVLIPLWLIFGLGFFIRGVNNQAPAQFMYVAVVSVFLLWLANILAGMFYILPQWERLALFRPGKSVGRKGSGLFFFPPFIYSVTRILDVRIQTYAGKAT